MSRTITRSVLAALALALPLVATSAAASTPDAKAVLTQAITDAAHATSLAMAGSFSTPGHTFRLDGGFTSTSTGGVTTLSGEGSEYEVGTSSGSCFVKATTLAILSNFLGVKSPTVGELNTWYLVPKSDTRYVGIASPKSAQTVAQLFSFSPIGWSRSATYEGTVVVKGVRVIKLGTASNAFASGSGLEKTTLYVTDTAHPLPFAMAGPTGVTGLLYFSGWGDTKVTIPSTRTVLPR